MKQQLKEESVEDPLRTLFIVIYGTNIVDVIHVMICLDCQAPIVPRSAQQYA